MILIPPLSSTTTLRFEMQSIGPLLMRSWCLLFCLLQAHLSLSLSQDLACDPNDLSALKDFLTQLQSRIDGWSLNGSSPNCCSWPGVSCDVVSRVTGLDLFNMSLKGSLSDSLSSLDQLQRLNLSSNSLQGPVPSALFNLSLLQLLDLSLNEFTGFFPSPITLPSLRLLNVSSNLFNGTHPVLSSSNNLMVLDISNNGFSGAIPDDLFGLQLLTQLNLQGNSLSGSLSSRISNLSNLVHLDLSLNNFSGSIPDVFGSLRKLESFSLSSNCFTASLPASFSSLVNLKSLNLRNNSLSGGIGAITGMTSLTSVDLSLNFFSGPIPDNLSDCSGLVRVNLARNSFSGEIPTSFMNLTKLFYLSLSNNSFSNLSSALKVLQHCPSLESLVLTMNFNGEVMPSAEVEGFKKMEVLSISYCALFGTIPPWLANCTRLNVLDISWNYLNGTIPSWLGDLDSLFYLDVSNNSLTGEIPNSFTQMKNLISFNSSDGIASVNDFPFFVIRNLSAMPLQYNQVSNFPPSLILSNNKLVGPIWPGFGALRDLLVLDLHMNALSGPIPEELSEMAALESLDLSYNNLSGTIPPSLTNLNFLENFDVAHNNLVGEIPTVGQFLTFSSSDFEGNPGLCGFNLSSCTLKTPPEVRINRKKRIGAVIGIALGIGLGAAFLLTVIYLAVSRTRLRHQEDIAKVVDDADEQLESLGSTLVLLFQNQDRRELTIDDILKSTNNFDQSHVVGCGGFGMVYKASLPDGRNVAIKRLSGDFCQMEREFQAEVETLSRAQHTNLVLLQGYCRIRNCRLLIYSYMENGSLDYWLHEDNEEGVVLNWDKRLRIAQGAARGLAYLHDSCQPHILHRDIKSSNILLDEKFEAHLADFGLARLILPQDTHVSTDLVGTLGYIPPEYGQASVATYRGDVYSFGVVLLELLTGKRPVNMCKPIVCRDLIRWVFEMKKEKREVEVFDPQIYDKEYNGQMMRVLEVACICVNESPKLRPLAQQIVKWLDDISSEE